MKWFRIGYLTAIFISFGFAGSASAAPAEQSQPEYLVPNVFSRIAEETLPSVVAVYVTYDVRQQMQSFRERMEPFKEFFDDPQWKKFFEEKAEEGEEGMRLLERVVLLNSIDSKWKDHLHAMDGLKTGIGLRSYGQLDPKVEYKVEGHRMFSEMLQVIREEVTDLLLKVRLTRQAEEDLEHRWQGAREERPTDAAPCADLRDPRASADQTAACRRHGARSPRQAGTPRRT